MKPSAIRAFVILISAVFPQLGHADNLPFTVVPLKFWNVNIETPWMMRINSQVEFDVFCYNYVGNCIEDTSLVELPPVVDFDHYQLILGGFGRSATPDESLYAQVAKVTEEDESIDIGIFKINGTWLDYSPGFYPTMKTSHISAIMFEKINKPITPIIQEAYYEYSLW